MTKINELKAGTMLSYMNIALNIVIGLLVTPLLLRSLGQSEFGLYQLIGAFVGYLLVFDFGIENAIIRYVAKYRTEKNQRGEENFLAMCLVLYTVMSLLALIVGAICYLNLHTVFGKSLTFGQMAEAKIMFAIMVCNLAISLPLNSFPSIINGYEKFAFQRGLVVTRTAIRTLLLIVLLLAGYKALAIVILDTALNMTYMAISAVYAFRNLKIRVRLHFFDRPLLSEVTSYSFFVFLGVIVDQLYWKVGQLILGITASTSAVAVFAVAMILITFYLACSTAVANVFLPRATRMVVSEATGEELTDLMIKTGRIQLIVLGLAILGFLLFGRQFIVLWAGKPYALAYNVAACIMIPLSIPLFQNVGISILQAKKMHAFRSLMYIGLALVNVGLSYALARKYGIIGVASGTAVSLVAGNIIVMNLYYHFKVGLNIPRFFVTTFAGIIPAMLLASVVGISVFLIPGRSWPVLIVRILLFCMCYAFSMWFVGMNAGERGLISRPIQVIRDRLSAA